AGHRYKSIGLRQAAVFGAVGGKFVEEQGERGDRSAAEPPIDAGYHDTGLPPPDTAQRWSRSAREVDHGQGHDYWKAAGRRGATARVRRSGARARREDVASAEDDVGAATAPGRGPGRGFAVARRDSCDTRRLA